MRRIWWGEMEIEDHVSVTLMIAFEVAPIFVGILVEREVRNLEI